MIAEVLGDSDVKAVRVEAGKVYGCHMVLLDMPDGDMRLLADEPLEMIDGRVVVDEQCRTSVEGVFALDRMAHAPQCTSDESAVLFVAAQGAAVGAAIVGSGEPVVVPVSLRHAVVEGLSISLMGTILPFSTAVKENTDVATGVGKSFSIEDDRLVGAVVVNAQKECEKYLSFIKEQGTLKEVDEFRGFFEPAGSCPSTEAGPLVAEDAPESPHPEDIG